MGARRGAPSAISQPSAVYTTVAGETLRRMPSSGVTAREGMPQ